MNLLARVADNTYDCCLGRPGLDSPTICPTGEAAMHYSQIAAGILIVLSLGATLRAETPPTAVALESTRTTAARTRQLSPEQQAFRDELRRCLAYYYFRPESSAQRAPWAVMHTLVGFGSDTPLAVKGESVNAIGWLCWNQPCQGLRLFHLSNGQISSQIAPGYQGHEGQFLQMVAYARVPMDFGMKIDGQDFTIADLVKREQETCEARTELSFKLVGLSHYLASDATWQNQRGETWSIPRLMREELAQPVNSGVACGGTHRLTGLGYSVRKRQQSGQPVDGEWARAKEVVDRFASYALRNQNPDGGFSTNWFEGPGNRGDLNRHLNTTGHTLEWLLLSLTKEQTADPRIAQAAYYLTALLWNYRDHNWEIGPRGHALHALVLYDERMFGGKAGEKSIELAQARDDEAGPMAGGPTPASLRDDSTPERRSGGLFGRGRR